MATFIRSTSVVTDTAITVPNLTGGTNGKVVRMNGSNSVTNAANSDTTSQLNTVLIKMADQYYGAGVVSGFTNLSPGSPYFLSTAGNITATPPTPSSTVRVLYLGFALNTTDLFFRPGMPITGV